MSKEIITRDIKSNVEIREQDDGKRTITGFIPYNSRSEWMGWFYEKIAPTAFNKSLADGKNVRALFNHDTSKVLGCVKNGSLRFENKEDGLHMECDLPDTTYARDAYELIKNGYNDQMSFGFRIIEQDYSEDEGGFEVHTLREVALEEVSFAVTFPAYSQTSSQARSLDKIGNILDKETISDEERSELKDFIDKLNSKLEVREEPHEDPINTEAGDKATSAIEEERAFIDNIKAELKSILGEN